MFTMFPMNGLEKAWNSMTIAQTVSLWEQKNYLQGPIRYAPPPISNRVNSLKCLLIVVHMYMYAHTYRAIANLKETRNDYSQFL